MKKRKAATVSSKQSSPQWRFSLTVCMLAGLASLLVWRVLYLQVLDTERGYEFLQGQGNARTIRTEVIPAYRGLISDRNGEPLAVSTPVASLWINPKELVEAKDKWGDLAKALGVSKKRIQQKIEANKNKRFVYLRRHMSPEKAKAILEKGIPGLYSQREYKRFYPAAEVASQLIGFTDVDDRGQEGLELAFNDWLQGEAGNKKVLKDLYGHVIKDIEQGDVARAGNDLTLSIDLRLQYLAYKELKAALQRSNAKSGSVVVMDARTSEVLAMVNQPSFNANNRRSLRTPAIRNRAVTDVFEPGSTMKPLTIVAALESGRYYPGTKIDTSPGYIRVGKKTLLDSANYGVIDVTKIITKSSQVGISKLALDLDEQSIRNVFQRFGFGSSTGSGFPGESAGTLPNRSNWKPIERVNFAFGYGLSVTPLQLAQAYTVFANGGIFRPASLLKAEQFVEGERIISEKIASQVVQMLKTVTEKGGTGTLAQVSSYSVAGKTGTIHKLGKNGYEDERYIAVFAGMAPASNPRLVTVVMIDEPSNGKYYGGEIAAPVFSNVVADALRLFDLPPDNLPEGGARAIAQAKTTEAKEV
jgi:cell division protein FtsI (penicillin-binding protein 3)